MLHPHGRALHRLQGPGVVLEGLETAGLALEELVHQVVGVTVVKGPSDISDTEVVLLHLKERQMSHRLLKNLLKEIHQCEPFSFTRIESHCFVRGHKSNVLHSGCSDCHILKRIIIRNRTSSNFTRRTEYYAHTKCSVGLAN